MLRVIRRRRIIWGSAKRRGRRWRRIRSRRIRRRRRRRRRRSNQAKHNTTNHRCGKNANRKHICYQTRLDVVQAARDQHNVDKVRHAQHMRENGTNYPSVGPTRYIYYFYTYIYIYMYMYHLLCLMHFKSFLEAVAPSWLNVGPRRATGTRFMAEIMGICVSEKTISVWEGGLCLREICS